MSSSSCTPQAAPPLLPCLPGTGGDASSGEAASGPGPLDFGSGSGSGWYDGSGEGSGSGEGAALPGRGRGRLARARRPDGCAGAAFEGADDVTDAPLGDTRGVRLGELQLRWRYSVYGATGLQPRYSAARIAH